MGDRIVGAACDRKKPLDDIERVARQRAALQRRLFEEAIGDFRNRASADIGGTGDRHQIGHQRQRRLAVGAGKGGEHTFIFVAARSGRKREPFEILLQADLAVEILDEPSPPHRVEIEGIDQRDEQRHISGANFDLGQPERVGGLQRQRKHFGVGCGAILPPEGFDAGLQEFARSAATVTKYRSEIAEAGRLAGAAGGEIIPRHWNGEVGAKAQLLAAGIGREIKAFPDVLARKVEERLGRLQDRRFGLDVARLGERQQQSIRPCGGSGRARGGGQGHLEVQISRKWVLKRHPAQPLSMAGAGFNNRPREPAKRTGQGIAG